MQHERQPQDPIELTCHRKQSMAWGVTHPPTYCDVKIQVATSSGCPVTKLSVLLAGWVEFVNKYDAHPPSSRSLAGIVVGRPAGLLLMCVAGLLALQGGQPAVFIGAIFAASSARANL